LLLQPSHRPDQLPSGRYNLVINPATIFPPVPLSRPRFYEQIPLQDGEPTYIQSKIDNTDKFWSPSRNLTGLYRPPLRKPPLSVRHFLSAVPAFGPACIWASLCTYFLASYLSRHRLPSGQLPRISTHYGFWPYISCIGAIHDTVFKAGSIATAICIITAFMVDYYLGKDIAPELIFILLCVLAFSIFGTTMDKMPFFILALTFSWSTGWGKEKLRANSPTLRSEIQ